MARWAGITGGGVSRERIHLSRAFSLVELLVVIGLIGFLISILLPTLASVRENANRTKCSANLMSISHAAQQHVNEHRGYLPCAGWHWSPIGGKVNPTGLGDSEAVKFDYYTDGDERRPLPITAAFSRYMGVNVRTDSRANLEQDLLGEALRRQWRCPSQLVEQTEWTQKYSEGWTTPDEYSSYAFNEAILGRRDRAPEQVQRSDYWPYPMGHMTEIRRTSEVFLFLDGRTRNRTDRRCASVHDYTANDSVADFQRRSGSELLDYYRHRRMLNVLFVDGHVQTMSMEDGSLAEIGVSKGVF
jgi:prepilin-type processing-associated H-X9-DG protein